jgi:ferritin
VEQPPFKYENLLSMFQEILKHEQYITASINNIYEICLNEKDYVTANFLQWYITEQLEEETLVGGILDQMMLAGNEKSGLYLIDKELGGMAAPAGAGSSAT